MKSSFIFLGLLALYTANPAQAAPVISEFLADNDGGLVDEDGDDSDWIEIHNPDANAIDLAGWRLTDNALNLSKWVFPSVVLQPGQRLVVWASNKNRNVGQLHTNFQLDHNGEYLALVSPTGTLSTNFSPVYPYQTPNSSFGTGYSGPVQTVDATPPNPVGGTHFSRIKITGAATATQDGNSLNVFDDALAQPEHQQYMWFDYSSALASVPVGQTVVEATLEWAGENKIFAGVSGLGTVTTPVGVFAQPNDGNRGINTIAQGSAGNDLVQFFGANTPAASVSIQQSESKNFVWNVTALVQSWLQAPAAGNYGKFVLVPGAHPCWIAWDQNRMGPKLTIRTQTAPTPVVAAGYMTPSPGEANSGVAAAGPLLRELTENPPQPAPAALFPITARISPLGGGAVGTVTLFYRKGYDGELSTTMVDDGTNGDTASGDGIYTGMIPAAQMVAGQMIRWRVVATDGAGGVTQMPPFRLPVGSPEYFGTVPVDASITTPLFTVHRFIQTPTAANNATGTRCSIFLNGEFYDNVGINLHGQSTADTPFLKKSYDIDGNRNYRFKWSLDPLQPRAKDINLLTNYADKTKVRHTLAYEMFREAGVAAHYCISTHCRLNGAFDGVYDFVEDGDDVYLERAGLNKDGVLYKAYTNLSNPSTGANGTTTNDGGVEKKSRKHENNLDLYLFLQGMHLADANARKAFLFDNVDLPKMVNLMAANTVTGNVDLHFKNYYIYCDTGRTNLWTLLPWDLDLSQGRLWTNVNTYFDDGIYINPGGTLSGQGQNLIAKLYAIPEISNMAKRRIRSLQDKFFKTSATVPDLTRWYDRRLSEKATDFGASIVVGQNDTAGKDAALDFTRYAAAQWKNAGVATTSPFMNNTMSLELQRVLSSWVLQRINLINADTNVPAAYSVGSLLPLTISAVDHSPVSGDQDQEFIEINNPNAVHVDLSLWTINGAVTFTFEPGTVVNANSKIYVVASRNAFKLRTISPKGGESRNIVGGYTGHLSNLGETINLLDDTGAQRATLTYPGAPSDWQRYLVISEIMYNPLGSGDGEYIELTNISTATTLNLTGVHFSAGIDYVFTGGTLAPGARILIVKNTAAFQFDHPGTYPIAGEFANLTALSNGGETVKLEDPNNQTIAEVTYDDIAPWPIAADGTGPSLVLLDPALDPLLNDIGLPARWRASATQGGNPGGADSNRFTGVDGDDLDGDGLTSLVEYFLGSSDTTAGSIRDSFSMQNIGTPAAPVLEFSLLVNPSAVDAEASLELCDDLAGWQTPGSAVLVEAALQPDGRKRLTWQISGSDAEGDRKFARFAINPR